MDISFDNTTQRLEFIEDILLDPQPINIYEGGPNPSIIIDPLECPDYLREYFFRKGYTYLFNIINI